MKYLFLSPYGAIDDWKFSEFQLQKILSSNNEIYLIGCQNILKKSCIAIKAHSNFYKNDYLKNKICKRCIKNQKDYGKKYKIFYLENYITKEDQLLVNSELLKINANNFVEYKFANYEIGKIALFETMLIFKKNKLEFTKNEFQIIKDTIFDTILFYLALKKIYKDIEPDIGIFQNGSYSLSKLFNNFLIDMKKKSYAWDCSLNYHDNFSKLFIKKNDNNYGINYIKNNWSLKLKDRPITKDNIKNVNKHFKSLINAKTLRNFSKRYNHSDKDLKDIYNISEKKIILLCTSSWDEVIATYIYKGVNLDTLLIFKDQNEWLNKCIEFFKSKKDCRLIIRPHPRDFDNKNSDISNFLKNTNTLPNNVTLNLPNHKVSLYTILKDVDLVLNAWSTLGMEAGILNIPTISISKELLVYPAEIENFQRNEKDYFIKINSILDLNNKQFDLELCKNFYNFSTSFMEDNAINLHRKRNNILYFLFKAINKITFFLSIKTYFKDFQGFNNDIKTTNLKLNKFLIVI